MRFAINSELCVDSVKAGKGSIIEKYSIIVECRGVEYFKSYRERELSYALFGTRTEVHYIPTFPL